MSREVPVRFREGLGVQFPRATRLLRRNAIGFFRSDIGDFGDKLQSILVVVSNCKVISTPSHSQNIPMSGFAGVYSVAERLPTRWH